MAITRSSGTAWALSTSSNDDPTGTSSSFTPAVDDVITVAVICDCNYQNTNPTVTVSSSGFTTSTWTEHVKRVEADSGGLSGLASLWSAVVTASASGTITASVSNIYGGFSSSTTAKGRAIADVWQGADTTAGRIDVTGEGSSTTNNITPTVFTATAAGRAIGAACDWAQLGTPASTDTETAFDIPSVISGLGVYKASDHSSGAQTLNFDAAGTGTANWNWCAIALKAAAGAGATPHYVFGKPMFGPFGGPI